MVVPTINKLATKEMFFSDLLLPQLSETYKGLTQNHLESILGNNSKQIRRLLAEPGDILKRYKDFCFKLRPSKIGEKSIALIGGDIDSYKGKESPRYAFLGITASNRNESGQERWVRLNWINKDYDENKPELTIDQILVLPQAGELYNVDKSPNYLPEKVVQKPREKKPELENALVSKQEMHVIKLVSADKGKTIIAVNGSDEIYDMIEVELVDGTYEVKVHDDGVIFKSPFSLTFPQKVVVDEENHSKMIRTLREI
jgi:hypothetical protein